MPENSNPTLLPSHPLGKFNPKAFQNLLHQYFQKYTQSSLLADKQGSIAMLPQDHMPCMVPDTKNLAKMPNGWNNVSLPYQSLIHPIPNPALPQIQFFRYNVFDKGSGIPTK